MRQVPILLFLAGVAGCSTSGVPDERLIGTWRSNGEQTIARMFERDPRWTNAPPEKVQKLKAGFGAVTITYGMGTIVTRFNGETEKLGYGVMERGADYVVIRIKGGLEDGQNERLRFVDDSKAYWIHSFAAPTIEERFDKLITEPTGPANGSQPTHSE
jgi:hypothetical protein